MCCVLHCNVACGCLLAIAEHMQPGYYSPAMVAPQVTFIAVPLLAAAGVVVPRSTTTLQLHVMMYSQLCSVLCRALRVALADECV
jgi:hypothetical protein